MFQNKIIISTIIASICINTALPAVAGYQMVYVPDTPTYVNSLTGQTIIVQGTAPTQTIIVKEPIPQTVIVQDPKTTYIPQTAYVSDSAFIAAGVTGLVGGILIGTTLSDHHKSKPHFKPIPSPKPHNAIGHLPHGRR